MGDGEDDGETEVGGGMAGREGAGTGDGNEKKKKAHRSKSHTSLLKPKIRKSKFRIYQIFDDDYHEFFTFQS